MPFGESAEPPVGGYRPSFPAGPGISCFTCNFLLEVVTTTARFYYIYG